ncbi:MAG: hypothetical protein DI534_16620, partial [Leifsonia xyli]
WLGLTPTRYQSGQIDRRGHVTKAGDAWSCPSTWCNFRCATGPHRSGGLGCNL